MRSMTSSSETKTILKDNFRKYWTVPALGLFWFLVWSFIPLMQADADTKDYIIENYSVNENLGYIIGICFLAIGSGMTVFAYLRDTGASNFVHSLPISRSRLFASNLLSGLLMIAVPIVINGILMSLATGSALFIKWILITGVSCFAIFAITVLTAMISGNTLMHLFNAAFVCSMVSLVARVLDALFTSLLLGYIATPGWQDFMSYSNPLMAFVGTESPKGILCVVYLAVGIAAILAGWVLYKKRPVERTENSLIFSWTRPALFLICVFCGAILSGLYVIKVLSSEDIVKFGGTMIIGLVIGSLIVFVVGSLMIDRSARIVTKRNLLPAAISLALAIAISAGASADVTGYGSKIPDTADVDTVYVDLSSVDLFGAYNIDAEYGFSFRYNANNYKPGDYTTKTFGDNETPVMGMTSKEAIGAATDIQKEMIGQDRNRPYEGESVIIVYKMKNGKEIWRKYEVLTDEVTDYARAGIDPSIVEAAGKLYDSKEFKQKYSLKNLIPELVEHGVFTYETIDEEGNSVYHSIDPKDTPALLDALEKDFQENKHADSIFTDSCLDLSMDENYVDNFEYYEGGMSMPVSKATKHTNAWLDDHVE